LADILSQNEVEMLLNAVSQGNLDVAAAEDEEESHGGREFMPYDFRRPDRVSKEQLKGLQSLFEAFSRELSILLPPFLRSVVRVDLVSIDQLTYDEFILSVSRPTSLAVVNMAPLEGNAVIEMSSHITFSIVDRVLGGKGQNLSAQRELTEIENRIVHRIILMVLDCLKRSWAQLIEFKLSVVNQESDPLIVQIVAGSEMTILVSYEVHMGETVGAMNLCIPLMVLTPVLDQISQQTRYSRKMSDEVAVATRAAVFKTVRKAMLPVDAVLGEVDLPLQDILDLEVGDIVQLDSDVKDPIEILIGGLPRFDARPGRRGEKSAVQLGNVLHDEFATTGDES
jgi:flagellar motor switch protein FliM